MQFFLGSAAQALSWVSERAQAHAPSSSVFSNKRERPGEVGGPSSFARIVTQMLQHFSLGFRNRVAKPSGSRAQLTNYASGRAGRPWKISPGNPEICWNKTVGRRHALIQSGQLTPKLCDRDVFLFTVAGGREGGKEYTDKEMNHSFALLSFARTWKKHVGSR